MAVPKFLQQLVNTDFRNCEDKKLIDMTVRAKVIVSVYTSQEWLTPFEETMINGFRHYLEKMEEELQIKNILNFDIMEMLHMNINVDQLLKELESVTITALDDNALCCLGLKLRMALIVMSQQENLTETQRQTIEIVRKFDNLTAREMEQRGYRVVDSAELTDADPEEIAEALVDMDFNALLDWADALKETSAKNEKDAEMLVHVNNEIMRRSLERSGGLLS